MSVVRVVRVELHLRAADLERAEIDVRVMYEGVQHLSIKTKRGLDIAYEQIDAERRQKPSEVGAANPRLAGALLGHSRLSI